MQSRSRRPYKARFTIGAAMNAADTESLGCALAGKTGCGWVWERTEYYTAFETKDEVKWGVDKHALLREWFEGVRWALTHF